MCFDVKVKDNCEVKFKKKHKTKQNWNNNKVAIIRTDKLLNAH